MPGLLSEARKIGLLLNLSIGSGADSHQAFSATLESVNLQSDHSPTMMTARIYASSVLLVLAILALLQGAIGVNRTEASTFVRMDFNLFLTNQFQSSVFIELFDDRPLTRNNFLQYVDGGHYDATLMHRLVPDFVLQGGGFYEDFISQPAPLNVALRQDPVDLDGNPLTSNPTVNNEFGNSPFRSNLRGTLAMAKTAAGPNSATNQYFFNLDNNSANLDNQNGGFTVFAQVVGNGMSLIDGLSSLSRTDLNIDAITQSVTGAFVSNTPDGVRDFGNFGGPFNEIPFLSSNLVRLEKAGRTDYFSSASTTSIPAGNLTLSNSLGFIEAGATFTGSGKLIVGAGKTLSAGNGAILSRPIDVSGTLDPGNQVGAVSTSTLRLLAGSSLRIQLGGVTAGSLYDQVNVVGTAALGGTLDVLRISSFAPAAGDLFTILTATSSITGNFTAANLPALRTGLAWDLQTSLNNVKLVVLPDYNGNGSVDQGDLTLWQANFGSTTNLAADGNGNGVVDGADFLIWQRFFGESVTLPLLANFAAIPEPNSLILAGLMFSCLIAWRQKPVILQ